MVPLRTRVAQHVPEVTAAARVESRRRLVEEQHGRCGDQARGQVEPAPHAARERLHESRRGVGQLETFEELVGALFGMPLREVLQATDHDEVLPGTEEPVDTRLLLGDADALAHRVGLGDDVVSRDACGARRRDRERGQDADRRRLPRAVVTEEPEYRPGRDVERQVPQRPEVAELLAEPDRGDAGSRAPRPVRCERGRASWILRMPYAVVVHSTTNLAVHCTNGK